MTNSYKDVNQPLTLAGEFDQRMRDLQVRAFHYPRVWRTLIKTGGGTRYADVSSSRNNILVTSVSIIVAPSDFAVGNFVKVVEDTQDNGFASGTTELLYMPAAANAYTANASFGSVGSIDANIYSQHDLRFSIDVTSGAVATEGIVVLASFLDESHLSFTLGTSAGQWDH